MLISSWLFSAVSHFFVVVGRLASRVYILVDSTRETRFASIFVNPTYSLRESILVESIFNANHSRMHEQTKAPPLLE